MTLQQFEYIIAVDQQRHFVKAAKQCGVTQSTLSAMVQKLETELDVQIFDRNAHPIEPTEIGEKIIAQAKVALYNAAQLHELVNSTRDSDSGELRLGVIPTIAPYIIPKFIQYIKEHYPQISITIVEAPTATLIKHLNNNEIDMGLMATPIDVPSLLEVPIYYEKFIAYVSPNESIYNNEEIDAKQLLSKSMWVLQEGHCWRNQVLNLCEQNDELSTIYESGSITTLVRIIDKNGGYTIIPELHLELLTDQQKQNIRKIIAPEPVREVSLVIRQDYVSERKLNIISDCIQNCVPETMVDARLKKFRIRL